MSLYPSDSLTSNTRLSARNFAATELVADITIAQTQFTVKDATEYPSLAAGEFFIAVISHANDATKKEVVKVTAVSSATWTVQRGYEGSASFAFPAKSSIECRLTAGTLGLIQGFVLKRPSGTSHQAYPFHEYLLDGGATLNFDSAHFAEGQRVRVRTYSANANQRVNLATSAGNFFILDGRCSWAEVAFLGGSFRVIGAGVDVFDAFWDAANNDELYPYRNYRAVYDGSLFVLRMPSGASNKARFTVKFEGFDGSQGKLGEVRLSGSEVFDLPFVSSVLTIDRPMVLTFQRINSGKWSIVDGVGIDGSYNALEKRVDKLEAKAWANVSELPSDVNSVRWASPAYFNCNAGETKWKWLDENTIVIAGIIRVISSVGANETHTVFTLPDGVSCEAPTQFLPWSSSVTDSAAYGAGVGGVIQGAFITNTTNGWANGWAMINWTIPVKRV